MLAVKNIKVQIENMNILKNISLVVAPGERVGLIGPNGHGKSVTMCTISGLFKPYEGEINFYGKSIVGLSPQKIVEEGIILVPEGGHLFPEMTVKENLLMGAYTKEASKDMNNSLEQVLALFPKLKILSNSKANALSGGELRMLAVGRGLMSKPRLLMLDEPTLGLAPNLVEEMGVTLNKIGQLGTSVILADENIDLIRSFAQRVYFIEDGEIKMEGPTEEVLNNKYVRNTFLGIEE
jgi:branched-chain amino acid transport system ATP-binding protein